VVDRRLEEMELEEFNPPTKPMKPVPKYTLDQALGLEPKEGEVRTPDQQFEKLASMFGRTVVKA
jgi:hypothetical protein